MQDVSSLGSDVLTPDVLVLGGGGTLGEAWMLAVLAGLEEAHGFHAREARLYLGTSAGSIVAASLVAGIAPVERLGELSARPGRPAQGRREGPTRLSMPIVSALGAGIGAPLASYAFAWSAGGGALLRRAALRAVPSGRRSLDELARAVRRERVSWADGRLRVVAVDLDSGRRVVFGSPGAPSISVAEAVQASCAVPGMFSPVHAAGRTYVDGGVWSPTNLDAAEVRREDRVLCLNPTGSLRGPAGGRALGGVSRAVAGAEALALRHRGAHVTTISPDRDSAIALGANLMDARRRAAVAHAGLAQGRNLSAESLGRAA